MLISLFAARLAQYQEQTNAFNISLIYLMRPGVPFCSEGYSCSKTLNENVTGIQSYPAICSFPLVPGDTVSQTFWY